MRSSLARVTRPLLSNIQLLRFVAAAAVLLSHAADLFLPDDSWIWFLPWTAGVDVFFVISGFVMVYLTNGQFGRRGASGAFLVRRLLRIAPPYWLFTTLMVATVLLFGEYVRNTQLSPATLATSFAFVPWPRADGTLHPLLSQGWTLNYEAFFYLAFAAALLFRRGLAWLGAGFVALAILHAWIPEQWFMLHFWSQPIIVEFIAGIGLGRLFLRGYRLPPWASVAMAVAAVVMLVARVGDTIAFVRPIGFGGPALLLCASLALSAEPRHPPAWRRMLIAGGDASYTLYLSHTFTVNAALLAWQRVGGQQPWLGLMLSVAGALVAALLLYRFIERPMVDALQRRYSRRSHDRTRDAPRALR